MFSVAESLRNFWLKGLHEVTGKPQLGVASWLLKGNFIFAAVTDEKEFSLGVLDVPGLTSSFAHDSTRMASASFETFLGITETKKLPRSCGWILIRAYYGAFFAAHALLRMCGTICFQLEAAQKNELDKVATAQSMLPPSGFEGGFYFGTYDTTAGEFRLKKSSANRRGSHEVMWELFSKILRDQSNELIRLSALHTDSAILLADIADLLCQSGKSSGNWLSHIRNSVTYRQELGVWFPYKGSDVTGKDLTKITSQWSDAPDKVAFKLGKSAIAQHVALCTIITSLCNAIVEDMHSAANIKKSFHAYGALALTNLAAQVV